MRNTRLPVLLNDPTWITTDSTSSPEPPPTVTSNSSCLMRIATVPSAAPSASEPTSPMKISAGYELYQRKPSDAPTSDPQNTVSSAACEKCVSSRYSASTRLPTTYASAVYAVAAIAKTLIARPSRPSVRCTALDSAVSTNAAKGAYHQPSSGISLLKKGKTRRVLYWPWLASISSATPTARPISTWRPIL